MTERPHCLNRDACAAKTARYPHCGRCAQHARRCREFDRRERDAEIGAEIRAGRPAVDLAELFGISRQRVEQIAQKALPPERVPVPAWVTSAGLDEDYIDMARDTDEFVAAAHCRALKRQMGASA